MYIGRFAPSPTGALHYGSLLAALASYLDAKSSKGLWLVRIDDIDPPREMLGACLSILDTLQTFGLAWDKDVIYQSQRYHLYQQALETLITNKQAYLCTCSRKEITQRSGNNYYDEHCLTHPPNKVESQYAWRFHNKQTQICWTDGILGEQKRYHPDLSDFILKRRDQLWAYQLAVAVDDEQMGITHIVRGRDLLTESAKQLLLINALGFRPISYSHIPLATNQLGQKLSKQNLAPALNIDNVSEQLIQALTDLGQKPDKKLQTANKDDILQEAISNWSLALVPHSF